MKKQKPIISAIACVSENRGIGKDGKLLFSIPDDMKFFREKTAGGVVIMGRKTLDSLPGGKPLKGRENIVLTRNADFSRVGVTVYNTLESLKNALPRYEDKEIFVIGGGDIYALLLPFTDILYLTEVKKYVESDSYFPEYENDFVNVAQSEVYQFDDLTYTFNTYERRGGVIDAV
jgi:dihydrofolate reductase